VANILKRAGLETGASMVFCVLAEVSKQTRSCVHWTMALCSYTFWSINAPLDQMRLQRQLEQLL
jgi:hypothetical protein